MPSSTPSKNTYQSYCVRAARLSILLWIFRNSVFAMTISGEAELLSIILRSVRGHILNNIIVNIVLTIILSVWFDSIDIFICKWQHRF